MAQQQGFGRQPLRNASPTFEPQFGDPKKMGIFGAPACRCTTLVLALCLALSGLVVCGVGGVIAGFMWSDTTPRILGVLLVVLGILMMAGGAGLFMWDSGMLFPFYWRYYHRPQVQQTQTVDSIQNRPAPVSTITATTTQLNRQAPPTQQAASARGAEAPPPYDDIMNTSVEYRTPAVNANNGAIPASQTAAAIRPSYQAAVGNARITSTTAV